MPTIERLTPRNVVFLVCAALMAALFARLGVWQLARLREVRAKSALVTKRLAVAPVPLAALPTDTAQSHFRRVTLEGHYDYAHEVDLIDLSREGSPGVHILTPLRRAGTDTAVLVDRGWVYAPDAMSINQAQWREADTVAGVGRVQEIGAIHGQDATRRGHPDEIRWVSPDSLRRWTGYPIAPYYVALEGDTSTASLKVPARIPPPELDQGTTNLSYAIQWFSFALIAIAGTVVAVFRPPTRLVPLR